MRLSKIKLAGFKSFVDPTTIYLPSSLVGVVGPNGCGKSNVIDAIRWVMGETSARHLRGDSMEDVIFNGSSSRKPVGTASIELFFDNADGSIGGQYASYSEISIRRVVARDGLSQYFLNNTRCRRKDITGLFLGTGLGPRSYAIIEQGMVSRLVEAKPEEMRNYIEEAAGISKYKERRRETETRISHTRENLSRLNDLREEVDKQIKHLQRQAQVAERYRTLKQQERQLEAELLAVRLQELDHRLSEARSELSGQQTGMDAQVAELRQLEADIERARNRHVEASDAYAAVQAGYYSVQSEISRLEQLIAHSLEMKQRQQADLRVTDEQLAEVDTEISRDQQRLQGLSESLAAFEPQFAAAIAAQESSAEALTAAESELSVWQESWQAFNLEAREHQQVRQVEETRLEHLDAHRLRLERQLQTVDSECSSISVVDLGARIAAQIGVQDQSAAATASAVEALRRATESLAGQRELEQATGADIETLLAELESRRGRLEALRAVQAAAIGSDEAAVGQWMSRHGLTGRDRLVHQLEVSEGWTRAVETVLGDFLQAIPVADCEQHVMDLPDTTLVLIEPATADGVATKESLASRVRNAGRLTRLLSGVICADSLEQALRMRARLAEGGSVITPDGIWLGPGWVRVSRGQAYSGLLTREQEIRELAGTLAADERRIAELVRKRAELRDQIAAGERERDDAQAQLADADRRCVEAAAAIAALRQDLERAEARLAALGSDRNSAQQEMQTLSLTMAEARGKAAAATEALNSIEERRPALRRQQEQLLERYNASRECADRDRDAVARLMVEQESRRAAREAAAAALERITGQRSQLDQRRTTLLAQLAETEQPVPGYQLSLDGQLSRQVEVQHELHERRTALESVEALVKGDESRRHQLERTVTARRDELDQLRMQVREIEVRREGLAERFAATAMVLEDVTRQLPPEAEASEWDRRLVDMRAKIDRLGPINLAAIDEFSEQSERKTYLDAQHADLTAALETLEHAIRKIDRETRTRFQETFDNINAGLKRLFPRLFGGGHAYLSMEGDDLLAAGVTVMARPPGKRNSHIHLLSGGEKALTAVALIFSIFELNPAPFCLLDEVDAPLDEANVGRFCDIVRDMAKTVQFVIITHNKTTMEMVHQLMGVTMNEPGVSRLVAVDVDEAVKLAAS
jgi:chromosome segregation protein